MIPGPWIDYEGDGQPVAGDVFVGVRFRNGQELLAERADALVWEWVADNRRQALYDIVAIRVWQKAPPEEPGADPEQVG